MTKKRIMVEMTFTWTFNEKDWSEEKKHIEEMRANPRNVLGYDILNAWHCLNDMTYPELKDIKVTDADE